MDSFKAVKKAAGVDDSSVLTESLVPQIDLSQYKLPHTDKEKKGLKNRPLLCVWGAHARGHSCLLALPYSFKTGSH